MNSWNPYNTLNLQKIERTDLFQAAQGKLQENRWYKPILDYIESRTKVNRVYAVSALGGLFSIILLIEYGTSLIAGCVGFVYPAYKTLKELETPESGLGRKWLMYWFLHAALGFFEIFFFVLSWLPGYWFMKCLFLMWCYAPIQKNGADIIYGYLIQPLFQKNQAAIDSAISQVVRTAHSICANSDVHYNVQDGHQHQN